MVQNLFKLIFNMAKKFLFNFLPTVLFTGQMGGKRVGEQCVSECSCGVI